MATTYKKVLKTLTIKTAGGTTITAADTATEAIGSSALAQFENFQTMAIKTQTGVTYVPFHAVDTIAVAVSQSDDITRPDAVCAEDSESE